MLTKEDLGILKRNLAQIETEFGEFNREYDRVRVAIINSLLSHAEAQAVARCNGFSARQNSGGKGGSRERDPEQQTESLDMEHKLKSLEGEKQKLKAGLRRRELMIARALMRGTRMGGLKDEEKRLGLAIGEALAVLENSDGIQDIDERKETVLNILVRHLGCVNDNGRR